MKQKVTDIREWFINEISERVDNFGLASIINEHNNTINSFNDKIKKLNDKLSNLRFTGRLLQKEKAMLQVENEQLKRRLLNPDEFEEDLTDIEAINRLPKSDGKCHQTIDEDKLVKNDHSCGSCNNPHVEPDYCAACQRNCKAYWSNTGDDPKDIFMRTSYHGTDNTGDES